MHLVFLLYALFASVFTAAKMALSHAEPLFLVGSRMLLAGFILFAYQLIFNPKKLRVPKKTYKNLFLLALFNIYITNAGEFWGMKFLTSSKTSFIYSLSPFFAALSSYCFLKERMSRNKWLGLILGFIGFFPILWQQTKGEISLSSIGFISTAELSVVLAAAAAVLGWTIFRHLVTAKVSAVTANAYSMIVGGLLSLIHSLFVEDWAPVPVHGSWPIFWQTTLWMIIVSSLICYNLYGHLLKRFSVTFLSFSGFTTPFFVAAFSWFFLAEKVSWAFFISGLIVFLALILFYYEEIKKEGIHKSSKIK